MLSACVSGFCVSSCELDDADDGWQPHVLFYHLRFWRPPWSAGVKRLCATVAPGPCLERLACPVTSFSRSTTIRSATAPSMAVGRGAEAAGREAVEAIRLRKPVGYACVYNAAACGSATTHTEGCNCSAASPLLQPLLPPRRSFSSPPCLAEQASSGAQPVRARRALDGRSAAPYRAARFAELGCLAPLLLPAHTGHTCAELPAAPELRCR